MATLYDVFPNEHIAKIAEELRKNDKIKAPAWATFVKTGAHKERPPANSDWWHTRVAAILRSVAILGPVGVSKLRTKYGGRKRRGHNMPEFRKGSGNIIRKALQQLTAAGLITFKGEGVNKGRVVTSMGSALLDKTATGLAKAMPKPPKRTKAAQKTEEPAEESQDE